LGGRGGSKRKGQGKKKGSGGREMGGQPSSHIAEGPLSRRSRLKTSGKRVHARRGRGGSIKQRREQGGEGGRRLD